MTGAAKRRPQKCANAIIDRPVKAKAALNKQRSERQEIEKEEEAEEEERREKVKIKQQTWFDRSEKVKIGRKVSDCASKVSGSAGTTLI